MTLLNGSNLHSISRALRIIICKITEKINPHDSQHVNFRMCFLYKIQDGSQTPFPVVCKNPALDVWHTSRFVKVRRKAPAFHIPFLICKARALLLQRHSEKRYAEQPQTTYAQLSSYNIIGVCRASSTTTIENKRFI